MQKFLTRLPLHLILAIGMLTAVSLPAQAQGADSLLFASNEVLHLTMPIDFDELCRPSESPDCDFTPTVFEYTDSSGQLRSVPAGVRRRDGWRAAETNCQVPTLFVRFTAEDAVGTPFEGQTTLALTSHCGKGISSEKLESPELPSEFESYVINEYLSYRLFNLVTDTSLKVRLARITYVDPDNPRHQFTRDAFFAEHFESLARRLGAELMPARSFDPARLDVMSTAQLALFQFMIGNTDWSIPDQENILLLRFPDGLEVPVAYDLDMSGLVSAHYAYPAPGLPIVNVRQRYFLGYCHAGTDWDALFAKFSDLKIPFISMLVETPGLSRGESRMSRVYLDSFFDILDSPEARQAMIIDACRPWPE